MSTRNPFLSGLIVGECFGVILISTPLAVAILRKPTYRERKDLVTILFLIAADVFYALAFGYQNLEKYIFYGGSYNSTMPPVDAALCSFSVTCITMFISVQVLGSINLMVAIDRLIATMWPTKYYAFGPRMSVLLMSVPFIVATFFYVVNCVLNLLDTRLMAYYCPYWNFPNSFLNDFYSYNRMVSVALTIPVYTVIAILLWKRTLRTRDLNPIQSTNYSSAHITMGLTTLSAIIFLLLPDLLTKLVAIGYSSDWRLIMYCVILTKAFANFGIYMWRHRELRRIYFEIFRSTIHFKRPLIESSNNNTITPIK